jgi:hypothetical protein
MVKTPLETNLLIGPIHVTDQAVSIEALKVRACTITQRTRAEISSQNELNLSTRVTNCLSVLRVTSTSWRFARRYLPRVTDSESWYGLAAQYSTSCVGQRVCTWTWEALPVKVGPLKHSPCSWAVFSTVSISRDSSPDGGWQSTYNHTIKCQIVVAWVDSWASVAAVILQIMLLDLKAVTLLRWTPHSSVLPIEEGQSSSFSSRVTSTSWRFARRYLPRVSDSESWYGLAAQSTSCVGQRVCTWTWEALPVKVGPLKHSPCSWAVFSTVSISRDSSPDGGWLPCYAIAMTYHSDWKAVWNWPRLLECSQR